MVRALVINGTVGVGKTTTAEAVGRRWRELGIPGAVIDVDWLRYAWPAPDGDPFNARLGLANLASLAAGMVRGGARSLVIADVIENAEARRAQTAALRSEVPDLEVRMVRLRADPASVRPRLVARHREDDDDGAGLAWHQRRVGELSDILDAAGADDAVVEVAGLRPNEVAARVLAAAGWDEPGPA